MGTYQRKNGLITSVGTTNTAQTDPMAQLNRLTELGANPSDYFKQAKQIGINPAADVLKLTKSGPDMPGRGDATQEKKKKSKKEKKKKDKKRKRSSSSSSSSD